MKKAIGPRKISNTESITAFLRFNDECNNGHKTFSITGEIEERGHGIVSCGCLHEEIAKYFPELEPFIKWHLCSTDGPMHYIGSAVYHASDKDCWGLRLGERRQIIGGRTNQPVWRAVTYNGAGNEIEIKQLGWIDSDEKPATDGCIEWVPVYRIGEGKNPNLEAARSTAIWPDAALEDLQDEGKLRARLPQLLRDFHSAMQILGLEE